MEVRVYEMIKYHIRQIIKNTEFENNVFAVGGCCRDIMLNKPIKDMDLVVSLENGGIRFAEWLERNNYTVGSVVTYPRFGTAMFRLKKFPNEDIEVVQTRTEVYTTDSRKPETAYGSLQQDCLRRDLTINAIYDDISNNKLLDICGTSFDDIHNQIIRTPCDPDQTYIDDPLRIMRCVRFSNRLKWGIEENTKISMQKNISRLSVISKERINDEFVKIIKDDPTGFIMLNEIGANTYIFPNLNISTQFIHGLSQLKKFNIYIKLAFFGMFNPTIEEDLKNLKFSNDDIKHIMDIINLTYKFSKASNNRDIREFCYLCKNIIRFSEVLIIARLLSLSTLKNLHTIISSDMFGYTLPLSGNDIMDILNIGPGKQIKEIQNMLLEYVFNHPNVTREALIEKVKQFQ